MTSSLFSIVIPTYNRAHLLPLLLDYFKRNRRLLVRLGVSLVFSENHSTDCTSGILSDFLVECGDLKVSIISPPQFLRSGEENLLWACSQVDSEFVWPLADDDIPATDALLTIYRTIRTRKYDLCILNACYSESLRNRKTYAYPSSSGIVFSHDNFEGNVFELAANLGPLNLFCNFLGLVFNRQNLLLLLLFIMVSIQRIYILRFLSY